MGAVNHPLHYNVGRIEVIDFIEDQGLGFCLGNAVKYLTRAEHKQDRLSDLHKARWYVERAIQEIEFPTLTSKQAQAATGTGNPRCGDLEAAILIALNAHAGQTDKGGAPYILHPMRVGAAGRTEAEQIAGLLHDVVEDTPVTVEMIRLRFGPDIGQAIDALSRRPGEGFREYIRRCAQNPLARTVKQLDLADNLSAARLAALPEPGRASLQKRYQDALEQIDRGG